MNGLTKSTLAALALYALIPAFVKLAPEPYRENRYNAESAREQRNASAFAQMLGEFRTSLSDLLFVKTERYLDSGVAYAPHVNLREVEGAATAHEQQLDSSLGTPEMAESAHVQPGTVGVHDHSHDHGHDHGHAHDEPSTGSASKNDDRYHASDTDEHGNVKTLIRTADADFRGFIGRMQRHVKPWRDPKLAHIHTAGTELLPWYRLATLSDPHNVRNYMVGAWWLKSLNTPEQRDEALKFLNEGIAANEDAYALPLMKGYVLKQMGNLEEARQCFEDAATKGLAKRPAGDFKEVPGWDVTDEEQLIAAITMDINLTRDLQSTGTALIKAESYEKALPHDGGIQRTKAHLYTGN